MDSLEQALELRDRVLEDLGRSVAVRSRGFQIDLALRLGAAIAVALLDIAASLQALRMCYEEANGDQ